MKLVLRYLVFGIAVLLSFGARAQTDTVNLAIIASINITLNDGCQALVIPEEILTGDFDVDGNGDFVLNAFNIVVEDGNEANGPVIDGCGSYNFRVTANPDLVVGFTTGWGVVNAEDKTAPFFTSTPVAPVGPLYCDQVGNYNLNVLPNTVSRCYTVNTQTNTIVAATLDPALQLRLLAGGGLPGASDNCSEFIEICVNDIITRDAENPDCEDVILTRTFTATDGSCVSAGGETNEAAVTSYEIVFTRPSLDDLNNDNIPEVVLIECGELEALGLVFGDVPAPRPQDLPFLPGPDGTRIPLTIGAGGSFCGLGITFTDLPRIVTCDRAYKIVRNYTVIDWCNTDDVRTFQQVVKIGDFTAPVFTAPTGVLQYTTNAGNLCGAYIRLDLSSISLTDACSEVLSLSANIYLNGNLNSAPLGSYDVDLNNASAEISGLLPVGNHIVRYTYSDECGNFDDTDVDISISDGTPPVALCEDGLNVSITSSVSPDPSAAPGVAVLTPGMIDAGSYDDCSPTVGLEIARVRLLANGTYELLPGAAYGPQVVLTCEDVGNVLIGLKVTDDAGFENYCWMSVLVEDKTPPTCVAPGNLKVSCVDYDAFGLPNDITDASDALLDATFGVATGSDNCDVSITQTISGSVNSCGVGSFTRVFTAMDAAGFTNSRSCTQSIEVSALHNYVIILPGDASAFCMQSPNISDVEVTENGCDLITTQMERDTFTSDADECYKIRIEHNIVNWCEYNTIGEPYQIRRDYDGDNNLRERTFLYVEPFSPSSIDDDRAYLDGDAFFGNNNFALELDNGDDTGSTNDQNGVIDTEPYGTDNSRGAFRYYQFVKIHDEVAPQIVADNPTECFAALNANCTGTVEIGFELTDNCTIQEQLEARVELDVDFVELQGFSRTRFLLPAEVTSDAEGNYVISMSNIPVGQHAVRVRGADNCGNVEVKVIEFCVEDGLAPSPICIMQTTVTLSPNGDGTGQATYWATDGLASDVQDCSGDVRFSIYKEIDAGAAGFTPSPFDTGIIFNCDDDATVPVRIYAFDPTGLNEYCTVLILVQRADNACVSENTGNLSGAISTVRGDAVQGVAMELTGPDGSEGTTTDASGRYDFVDLPGGDDYTVDPTLETYVTHSQGVSTFDLVLITRFILGLEDFQSPFQRLAADANGDEDVSVQDIIAIRRLLLGFDDAYRNNSAWRFVESDFVFPVNANPWATNFPEVININNLNGSVRNADFIAIMIGDVSGNAPSGFTNDGGGRPRSGKVMLETSDLNMVAGNTYEVTIDAAAAADLEGLQGTFSLSSGVRLIDVDYGQLTSGNLNTGFAARGLLPFSFNAASGLNQSVPVVTLRIEAIADVRLSDALEITDDVIIAEGYTQSNGLAGVGIRFTHTEATPVMNVLEQNTPNPVAETTVIRFTLEQAGNTTLSVRDISGRVILEQNIVAVAGENALTLNRKQLGASGILTYTLTAKDFTATRKMMVQ
ncbi:T9SS type A sorting domain-containing protein [Neolewinella persica]|uniref:T9SS type A sorting domain-containing protein n=1 Tax=Neolewinella persica TaxID=70998 RepID=UPI000374338C|nr:T9SS type A sorting domain-containing protein [Neolewinella persica]